ncbi:phosphatase PAP2 family protein [Corynebacterium caspium]|uniref:phosphatase PAP2 family protein n=1 Tax=Corynebacterium caspium TaxID=234828 RepID=UPI00037ED8DB|nr:phosphatase PAP2 family protein [Corynebacterium caspium]WKD59988.1 PAP2 superfamily protein [Corynebacterium caspium DSM 44850]
MSLRTHESNLLVAIQKYALPVPGIVSASRAASLFGEHALGWMTLGAVGAGVDKRRRDKWLAVSAAAFVSHAASVVLKRIVRRKRPDDPRIVIGVGTPSKLSFPSSHATSTTAALVSLVYLTGNAAPLVGIPAIMLSRMVLGVHFPTDTVTGAVLGAGTAVAVNKALGGPLGGSLRTSLA